MARELRIRRDRSALANGSVFGRRRSSLTVWKLMLWFTAMGFMGLVWTQIERLQPQVMAMVGTAPTATPPALFFAQLADNAYWRGDLDTAIANYTEAVKQFPGEVNYLYELVRLLVYRSYADRRNIKDIEDALKYATQAVDANPNNSRAFTIMCFAQVRGTGLEEDAVRSCLRALDLNPNDADAHAYLSFAYASLIRYDAALEEAQRAVQLNENSIDAHRALAIALHFKGRFALALEEYKKAASINPQLELPYFELAGFAVNTNQPEIAITTYNRILSMNKRSVKAYTRLCETYYRIGESEMAMDNCATSIDLDPEYTDAHKWLGQVYYTRRNYEDAVKQFAVCAEQEEKNGVAPGDRFTECWYLRGLAHFILDECDQAMPIFLNALEWVTDANVVDKINIGINKCATAYQGTYMTPTPRPTATEAPPPIFP